MMRRHRTSSRGTHRRCFVLAPWRLLASALALCVLAAPVEAQVLHRVVYLEGEPAPDSPDGRGVRSPGAAVVGPHGEVLFYGRAESTAGPTGYYLDRLATTLVAPEERGLRGVATRGQMVTRGGETFTVTDPHGQAGSDLRSISSGGAILFEVNVATSTGDVVDAFAVWRDGGLELVATAEDVGGALSLATINDAGRLALVSDDSDPATALGRFWVEREDGQLEAFFTDGDAHPTLGNRVFLSRPPFILDDGRVLAQYTLRDDDGDLTNDPQGLVTWQDGTFTEHAVAGAEANPAELYHAQSGGAVAVRARVVDSLEGTGENAWFSASDPSGVAHLVDFVEPEGTPIDWNFGELALDATGAALATYAGSLFRIRRSNQVEVVFARGSSAPDGSGTVSVGRVVPSASGITAGLVVTVTGSDGTGRDQLWLVRDLELDRTPMVLARVGDAFEVRPGDERVIQVISLEPGGVNELRHVAATLYFEDGSSAIVVFNQEPVAQASADLLLRASVQQTDLLAATVTATVDNLGPGSIGDFRVEVGLPPNVVLARPVTSCREELERVVCEPIVAPGEMELVAAGMAHTLELPLLFPSAGQFELSLRVTSTTPDPVPANDATTLGLELLDELRADLSVEIANASYVATSNDPDGFEGYPQYDDVAATFMLRVANRGLATDPAPLLEVAKIDRFAGHEEQLWSIDDPCTLTAHQGPFSCELPQHEKFRNEFGGEDRRCTMRCTLSPLAEGEEISLELGDEHGTYREEWSFTVVASGVDGNPSNDVATSFYNDGMAQPAEPKGAPNGGDGGGCTSVPVERGVPLDATWPALLLGVLALTLRGGRRRSR